MLLKPCRLTHGEIRLEVGFKQVSRGRQNIRNQVLGSDDLVIVGAIDRRPCGCVLLHRDCAHKGEADKPTQGDQD